MAADNSPPDGANEARPATRTPVWAPPAADHDHGYKLLFGHAEMVRDLLVGFVDEPWVKELRFDTLQRVSASSVTAMLSVSGCQGDGSFVFLGFLPSKSTERQTAIQSMSSEARTQVFLEAPHRIEALAKDLRVLGMRELSVGRELTKQFEEVARLPAQDFAAWLEATPHRAKGEFALVLHPLAQENTGLAEAERVLDLLLPELPVKTAVKLAAQISGAPRNALYALALQKKPEESSD
jgi:16S rRNA (cytidine1402-2'-O)-methyltransferase